MARNIFTALQDSAWRMMYRLVFPVAKLWWAIAPSRHQGALVATYVGAELLLIRACYRRQWNFPGGGVKHSETPEAAAKREFEEETGLPAPALVPKFSLEASWEGRRETVHFFELHLDSLPPIKIDNREIVEARLVGPEELATMELTGPVQAYLNGGKVKGKPLFF